MLQPEYTPTFKKDIKRLTKKHQDTYPLRIVIELILENSPNALDELKRHHSMHVLRGKWAGSNECHVADAGDWLLIWRTGNGLAVFQRTGSHDELFK
jgi:mRNA interferase YafQ